MKSEYRSARKKLDNGMLIYMGEEEGILEQEFLKCE